MAEERTIYFGDGNKSDSVPAWLPFVSGNGGFGNGFGGWGGGILGFFLGLLFGNGGFGNWGGFGGGRGAGYLANQLNNDNNTDLLMNAINSQGESSRTAIQSLATALGQDFNLVNNAVSALQTSLNAMAINQATSVPNIINAIQNGNAAMSAQLAQCCCENRLLTTQQGYESRIQNMQQTETLGSKIDANGRAITDAIAAQSTMITKEFCDVKEREMQAKIDTQAEVITQLRGQIDNANQTAQITGYVNGMIAPMQAKIAEIASKMPNTVPVQYPNLVAVNATPYVSGGYYPQYPQYGAGNGYIF